MVFDKKRKISKSYTSVLRSVLVHIFFRNRIFLVPTQNLTCLESNLLFHFSIVILNYLGLILNIIDIYSSVKEDLLKFKKLFYQLIFKRGMFMKNQHSKNKTNINDGIQLTQRFWEMNICISTIISRRNDAFVCPAIACPPVSLKTCQGKMYELSFFLSVMGPSL